MKKRIEEDDVIYIIEKNSGDCIDIDVKPGVEEVSFNASFGREYLLGDCKKVFPDVKKIVIDYSVYDIDIPNTLFPNVKEVECSSWYGKYIKSGNLLLRNDNGQILTNVFGKKEGEEQNGFQLYVQRRCRTYLQRQMPRRLSYCFCSDFHAKPKDFI